MPNYDIIDLGLPLAQSGLGTEALDLNDHGQTAGVSFYVLQPDPTLNEEGQIATFWDHGGEGTLLESPGIRSSAHGISNQGSVVGAWGSPVTQNEPGIYPKHGFLYRNGSMVNLGPVLGTDFSFATAINDSDTVVGRAGGRPFIYDAAAGTSPVYLGALPGHDSASAQAINNAGVVVGFSEKSTSSGGRRGFLYAGGPLVDLGPIGDVMEISNTGLVAGSIFSGGHRRAAVYDMNAAQPQFTPIGQLPGHDSGIAFSVNDEGAVVGNSFKDGDYGTMRAFLYQDGTMADLNDLVPPGSGWVLRYGKAINNAGQIAAHGTFLGETRSCLLVPAKIGRPQFSRDFLLVVTILFGVIQDGGGLGIRPGGGPPIPIDPMGWSRLGRDRQDILTGLAVSHMASLVRDPDARRHVETAGLRVIEESLRKLRADLDAGRAPRPGASPAEG